MNEESESNQVKEEIDKKSEKIANGWDFTEKFYYLTAFDKLEKKGEHTWNLSAFLFQVVWLFYRKMYAYGIICLILDIIIFTSELQLLYPIISLALGYYGNSLYYEIVKERTSLGYHLMDNQYKTTSKSLGLMCLIGMFFPKAVFDCFYMYFPVIICCYYLADTYDHKMYFKERKLDNNKVSKHNILKYLSQDKQNSFVYGFMAFIGIILFLMICHAAHAKYVELHPPFWKRAWGLIKMGIGIACIRHWLLILHIL